MLNYFLSFILCSTKKRNKSGSLGGTLCKDTVTGRGSNSGVSTSTDDCELPSNRELVHDAPPSIGGRSSDGSVPRRYSLNHFWNHLWEPENDIIFVCARSGKFNIFMTLGGIEDRLRHDVSEDKAWLGCRQECYELKKGGNNFSRRIFPKLS